MTPARNGFVFAEAMVALAVVAVAVGLLFAVLGDGLGRSRATAAARLALLLAQSRLAAVGTEIPVRAGTVAGNEGAFVWHVDISPYRTGAARSPVGDLFLVEVTVRPRTASGGAVQLRSLRLAPPF